MMVKLSRMRLIASHPWLADNLVSWPRLAGYTMFAVPFLTTLILWELIR